MLGRDWSMKKPSPPETPAKGGKTSQARGAEQINENNAHEKPRLSSRNSTATIGSRQRP